MEFLPGHWRRGRPRRSPAVPAAAPRRSRSVRRHSAARAGSQPRAMHWGPRRGRRAARRWVGGTEAGTRDRPRSPRTMEGWWGRGGRLVSGFCSAPPTQRQGRAIRGRAAHRARTLARGAAKCGQFSGASNEPIFAAICSRGAAPRRSQCVMSMMPARSRECL
jgi:hypothetical protein